MTRKFLTALLSLVVAFGLWVYVVTVVSPEYQETYRDIPVKFIGESVLEEDRHLMLILEETPTVTLHLSGNRSDHAKLSSSNITVTVDLSKVYEAGKQSLLYNVSYPGNVSNNAFDVLSREPSGLTVEIVERGVREVPIQVEYTGELPEDFIKDKPEMAVQTIRVEGPRTTVEKISAARIQVPIEGLTQTLTDEFAYTLVDEDGEPVDAKHIKTNLEAVGLTLPIQRVKEIPLQVNVIYGGGLDAQNTTITLNTESIMVSGSEQQLATLETLILGEIDLNQYTEDTELVLPIKLDEGITNETGITEVKVTIDLPERATKVIKVTQITAVNVPAGLTAEISTQEIDVTVRGYKSHLEDMTGQDLAITVDFTGAQDGTDRFEAVVTVSSRYPNVGVVGTYTVLANLTKAS